MASKLVVILLTVIAIFLGLLIYWAFFRPDPCVVVVMYEEQYYPKWDNSYSDLKNYYRRQGLSDTDMMVRLMPENVRRKYHKAYFDCMRSMSRKD